MLTAYTLIDIALLAVIQKWVRSNWWKHKGAEEYNDNKNTTKTNNNRKSSFGALITLILIMCRYQVVYIAAVILLGELNLPVGDALKNIYELGRLYIF